MKTIFDDSFYTGDENEKPTWDDDIDTGLEETGEPDAQPAEEYNDEGAEDFEYPINTNQDEDDLMMDADYLPGGDKYAIADDASGKGKKSKKDKKKDKKKKGKMIEEEVAAVADSVSEPIAESKKNTKRAMEKYMEEYYNLNYEDMIGDLPTRFKYRKVDANNFGLSPVEILLADDKDLNQVAGLKILAPYVACLCSCPFVFQAVTDHVCFIQIPPKREASKRQSSLRKEQEVQVARIPKEAQRPRMEVVAFTPINYFLRYRLL